MLSTIHKQICSNMVGRGGGRNNRQELFFIFCKTTAIKTILHSIKLYATGKYGAMGKNKYRSSQNIIYFIHNFVKGGWWYTGGLVMTTGEKIFFATVIIWVYFRMNSKVLRWVVVFFFYVVEEMGSTNENDIKTHIVYML